MPIATIIALLTAILPLIESIPELVASIKAVIDSLNSGTPLTADQQAAIDAGLEAAHQAAQAAKPKPSERAISPDRR